MDKIVCIFCLATGDTEVLDDLDWKTGDTEVLDDLDWKAVQISYFNFC